jgi:hypothetical protein
MGNEMKDTGRQIHPCQLVVNHTKSARCFGAHQPHRQKEFASVCRNIDEASDLSLDEE